jgi:hypothetical protein
MRADGTGTGAGSGAGFLVKRIAAVLSSLILILLGVLLLARAIAFPHAGSRGTIACALLLVSFLVLFRCAVLRTAAFLPLAASLLFFSAYLAVQPRFWPRLGGADTANALVAVAGLFFLFRYLAGKGKGFSAVAGSILLFLGLKNVLEDLGYISRNAFPAFLHPIGRSLYGAHRWLDLLVPLFLIAWGLLQLFKRDR